MRRPDGEHRSDRLRARKGVIIVGSYMHDLTMSCAEFPRPGQTVVGALGVGPGGKGSNQAVAASRAGAATVFVGAVGRDPFAAIARRFYRQENLQAVLVPKTGQATGLASILVNRHGENKIAIAPGANDALRKEDVPLKLLVSAKIVLTQLEANLEATAFALRVARAEGIATLLNPAPLRAGLDPAILSHVDILVPNEHEFRGLLEIVQPDLRRPVIDRALRTLDPHRLHALCRKLKVPVVIITLGKRGCFVSQRDSYQTLTAHSGIKAVDTTGAGDAFCGGFAAGYDLFGGDLVDAATYANAVAALSVTKAGAASAMPYESEVKALLKRTVWRREATKRRVA